MYIYFYDWIRGDLNLGSLHKRKQTYTMPVELQSSWRIICIYSIKYSAQIIQNHTMKLNHKGISLWSIKIYNFHTFNEISINLVSLPIMHYQSIWYHYVWEQEQMKWLNLNNTKNATFMIQCVTYSIDHTNKN